MNTNDNSIYLVKESIFVNKGEIPVGAIVAVIDEFDDSIVCTIKPFLQNNERTSLSMTFSKDKILPFCTSIR